MTYIVSSASAIIPATAETVYKILADYQEAHPAILPKPYFAELELEYGGIGLDTEFRLEMNVFGNKQYFRMRVIEAIPYSKIVEYDELEDVRTTFDIQEKEGGTACEVGITTLTPRYVGLSGWLESVFTPIISRMIFNKQLKLLSAYAQNI